MTQFDKLKLHEICESVKESYLLNTIEESTNEVEILKTKKFLNETTATIERILVEENIVDAIKAQIIEESVKDYYDKAAAKAQELYGQAKDKVGQYYDQAAAKAQELYGKAISPIQTAGDKLIQSGYGNPETILQKTGVDEPPVNGTMGQIKQSIGRTMVNNPGAVLAGAAGLGAAGLGAAGYGAYEAMQDPSMIDQASDMVSGMM